MIVDRTVTIANTRPIASVELYYDNNRNGSRQVTHRVAIDYNYQDNTTIVSFEDSTISLSFGGRIRFAQGLSGISPYQEYLKAGGSDDYLTWYSKLTVGIPDAPADGNCYVRRNGEWIVFTGCPDDEDPPQGPVPAENEIYYGFISAENTGDTTNVAALTEDMIMSAVAKGTVVKSSDLSDRPIKLNPSAYSWVFALVPSTKKVLKDDGLGGKVQFLLDNGIPNSGANKIQFTLGDLVFDMYGELQIVTAETTLYIESVVQ